MLRTRIHIAIVFRNEINVVEDEALERVLLQSFDECDVHDSRLVERVLAILVHSTAIVYIQLSIKHR